MTPTRETIARAIFETYSGSAVCQDWAKGVSWDRLLSWPGTIPGSRNPHAPAMVVDMIRDEADAVLRALDAAGLAVVPRDPTEAMMNAGYRKVGKMHYEPTASAQGWGEHATDIYRAMIAAAPDAG
jgi:hypothetical protein